jgi:hypothetical protein
LAGVLLEADQYGVQPIASAAVQEYLGRASVAAGREFVNGVEIVQRGAAKVQLRFRGNSSGLHKRQSRQARRPGKSQREKVRGGGSGAGGGAGRSILSRVGEGMSSNIVVLNVANIGHYEGSLRTTGAFHWYYCVLECVLYYCVVYCSVFIVL